MWDENLLTLHCTDYGEQNPLVFSVDYATEIWSAAQIQMLWSQAVRLAIQLLKHPLAVWRELPVGVGLKSRLVHRKTMPPLGEVPHVDFLQTYRQACASNPHHVALITAQQTLSFENLQHSALQIAAYLQSLENHIVALLCPRNANLLIGILGIWQAGKTPLLLSPQDSAERHQQLLSFCYQPFLLTDIVIEALIDPDQAPRNLINTLPTEAYLTFTSGSTGEPKPVLVSATAYTNTKQGWSKYYQLENSIHLQWAAQTFDVFWGDVARSVLSGETLVLLDENQRLDPNLLVPIIAQYQVTHWETTPGFALLLTNDLPMLRSLRLLVVGSDKLTWSAAQALRQALPANTQLLNSYGLTECTIDSSFWVVPNPLTINKEKLNSPTPIGFPLPNQQLWVMDRYQQALPIGALGEVWIAGYSLADDTLWQDDKLYATGDLGYYHPQDGLVLVGRADTQLKINGLRINPKEIEQALLHLPWVIQAAVVQHHSHQQLVAWIQTTDLHFNWPEQRQYLFALLPAYAIPHQAFAIDSFPLTAHGKIDYKALAQKNLPATAPESTQNYIPLTPSAQALAHSLRQTGAPEALRWDRNLYENGLHSIQVIRIVGLLRENGWQITLAQVLQSESLVQVAELLTQSHPQKNPQTFEKPADDDIDWDNLLDALNEQLN
ncbi:MAG TPA: hypothetical protein DCM08_12170 [Microscillaceae bacterium]|nr:hypothetical protein [Microscillaceae bacterium]